MDDILLYFSGIFTSNIDYIFKQSAGVWRQNFHPSEYLDSSPVYTLQPYRSHAVNVTDSKQRWARLNANQGFHLDVMD
jgi:hypothetical protein